MIFRIATPKPPDDIWPVAVDFSARLDTEGGETIDAAEVQGYKIAAYNQLLADIDLTNAERITLSVERYGQEALVHSYPVLGQEDVRLVFPQTYPREEADIVPPDSVVIGPPEGGSEPPYTTVGFKIAGGDPGTHYEVSILVVTSRGNIHSCLLHFWVEELGA